MGWCAVNPKHRELGGEPVYARAADLPAVPDLAVICTPPATVAGLIEDLGAFGTRAVVVLSENQRMLALARELGFAPSWPEPMDGTQAIQLLLQQPAT